MPPKVWQEQLLAWYDDHGRPLPWRQTRDPYAIWVSEIMCQQTQVGTVIPYYLRWMERFPSIDMLAAADEQDVLSAWQGLGYYRRARYLLQGARFVVEQGLPASREEWLRVPGVGRYTAGAIASITLGEVVPVVDGNVERVYSRLTADSSEPPKLHAACWRWADDHVQADRPGDWNQAIMELGAMVCKPLQPLCDACPLRNECRAFALGCQLDLPSRAQKPKLLQLEHHVWVPFFQDRLGVRQIPRGEWWEGMWEFPRAESEAELVEVVGDYWPTSLGRFRHSVTNHRITLQISRVECGEARSNLHWLSPQDLANLPMPAPQRRALRMALAA